MGQPSPQPWRVERSREVISDRWIRLRADDCVDALGRTIAPFYVLEYGDWVSVAALTPAGEAVAVVEYHHGAGVTGIGLVGGAIEGGEAPADAAVRELAEETGYAAGRIVDLGWTWANWGNQNNRVHHLLALDCVATAAQQLDEGEIIDVVLLPQDGLADRLPQTIHQLTWFRARERLRD
ncbi:NUDIX hydrolase [Microbacterium sp.]|uniref:NUDIX hydrolase n=1 Tax=Microbacterium sp. TaxID=51671 RepID=UPI00333FFA59